MGLDDDANHQLKFSQLVQLQERFDEDPSIENYVSLKTYLRRLGYGNSPVCRGRSSPSAWQ